MIAFSTATPAAVKFYNTLIRENPLYQRLPSLIPTAAFKTQYVAMRPFFRRQFPWHFLREGQTVIQVSSAKMLLPMGLSQALIMSVLVGPRGRVVVVEPDPSNVAVLKAYLNRNHVGNVTVIQKGVWSVSERKSFTVIGPRTSANVMTEALPAATAQNVQRQGWTDSTSQIEIEVDNVDGIIRDNQLGSVAFINITINGCEYEAIEGMSEVLKQDVIVTFPLQNPRTFHSPILNVLEREGFQILLDHSPVFLSQQQCLVACALRRPAAELIAEGWEEVALAMRDEFIELTAKQGTKRFDHLNYQSQIRWL